jgi:hypothetical protein
MSVRGYEPWVENALSETRSLNGQWRFRLGSLNESTLEIPGAWQAPAPSAPSRMQATGL